MNHFLLFSIANSKIYLSSSFLKDENGDLQIADVDSHNIFNRWKNYCYQLLNVHGVNHVSDYNT
jgi:hypothetical protein